MTFNFDKSQTATAPADLRKYIDLVNRCARERLNHPIANGSPVHARILIAKLFETALTDVRLVSGSLRQRNKDGVEIYAEKAVIEQATRFLRQPKSSLSIIIQTGVTDGADQNVFIKSIADDKDRQGNITINIPKEGVLGEDIPHFMEADSSTYRLETGADAKPSNSAIAAIANFGDVKTAKSLAEYFADIVKFVEFDNNLLKRICLKPGDRFSLV